MVSGEYMNWGQPGPGKVTIYANPVHMFGSILGRFFGTHGSEGAGWYAGSPLPGFAVRHVPLGAGEGGLGMVNEPKVSGHGTMSNLVRAGMRKATSAANHYLEAHAFGSIAAIRRERRARRRWPKRSSKRSGEPRAAPPTSRI